jgi:hypothetical protein
VYSGRDSQLQRPCAFAPFELTKGQVGDASIRKREVLRHPELGLVSLATERAAEHEVVLASRRGLASDVDESTSMGGLDGGIPQDVGPSRHVCTQQQRGRSAETPHAVRSAWIGMA